MNLVLLSYSMNTKTTITFACTTFILSAIILIPNAFADNVPDWVKNTAGWWATDAISEAEFVNALEFLIKENIIHVDVSQTSETSQGIPDWVKNTAGWWATDAISEAEFVNAITYLIKVGIIIANNNLSCVNDLSEIFGDSNILIRDICNLHESNKYSELIPLVTEPNLNSHGFRGTEFSEAKSPSTYRIFMIGGSTMFGSGATSDQTTIPGILQKMFDSDNSIQKIEVINAGLSGANSDTELELIDKKLIAFSPNLVIVYDGLNNLKADFPVRHTKDAWKSMCELGKYHNFDVIITLQPINGFGNKKLTQQEIVNSFTGEDHQGFQLIAAKPTYDYIGRELLSLQNDCDVIDLRGIFDNISGPIYWDQGHVSDTGNLILAEKFHEIINEIIFKKKSNIEKFHNLVSKYHSPVMTSYLLSKIDIDIDYTQLKKQDLASQDKRDGNYFYLKNQLGGSEKILVGRDLSKIDLAKINLTGQNLSGANLSGQDLRGIDFTDTVLLSTNLSFANLSGQDLSGKNLRGTNFHNANLENADLSNIILSKKIQSGNVGNQDKCSHPSDIIISRIFQERCIIEILQNEATRTDFSNANLRGSILSLSESDFIHFIDFSGADLTGIEFSNIKFRACKFNGTDFSNSNMHNVAFVFCDFSDSKLFNSKFFSTAFQNVSFFNAKIIDSYFETVLFIDTDFSDADLDSTLFVYDPIMIGHNEFSCKNHQICD